MADFTALKSAIQTYIKQNGNEEITGEKLQEILLSVVTTLGDSAINDLVTALANEVAARQNADGTLQQYITNEATARGNADTALGGRIDDEKTARANGDTALSNRLGSTITAENTAADQIGAEAEARAAADTALQNLIDGITNNIENGYVYAGIATPSSTPATGKVFYLALTAGTYTNFGNTVVSQGINILKYNGSAWSLDAFIGIDDELTPGSNNLPKSGNVLENIIKNGSAFDLSAYNAVDGVLATYADLDAALTALNALPAVYKQSGMSFRFVRTSDNKYVQYILTKKTWSTNENDWINITEELDSIKGNISKENTQSESEEFRFETDSGTLIGKINENGADFINIKKNGQIVATEEQVPTKDTSIGENPSNSNVPTSKAVKDYVDGEINDIPVEVNDTHSDDEEMVFSNEAGTEAFVKIGSYGIKAKGFFDINGSPIGSPPNVLEVSCKGNKAYSTINAAVTAALAIESAANPITILIYPGVYKEVVILGSGHHISFVGINKKDVIWRDDTGYYENAPLRIASNSYIANITFIATHSDNPDFESETQTPNYRIGSYALHIDIWSGNSEDATILVENCDCYSEQNAAMGAGLYNNKTLIFRNCTFKTYMNEVMWTKPDHNKGAWLIHRGENATVNQKVVLDNCRIIKNRGYAMEMGGFSYAQHGMVAKAFYNIVYSEELGTTNVIRTYDGGYEISSDSFGNNVGELNNVNN